jgi:hypothetical protein
MTAIPTRSAIALLLMCACTMAAARGVPSHGANGGGGSCPEMAAAKAQAEEKAPPHAASSERGGAPTPAAGGKPASARESGNGNARMQAPRWHSFLPGMFR